MSILINDSASLIKWLEDASSDYKDFATRLYFDDAIKVVTEMAEQIEFLEDEASSKDDDIDAAQQEAADLQSDLDDANDTIEELRDEIQDMLNE